MPTFSAELKTCSLIALWILLLRQVKILAPNLLMTQVSYLKDKDVLLLKVRTIT